MSTTARSATTTNIVIATGTNAGGSTAPASMRSAAQASTSSSLKTRVISAVRPAAAITPTDNQTAPVTTAGRCGLIRSPLCPRDSLVRRAGSPRRVRASTTLGSRSMTNEHPSITRFRDDHLSRGGTGEIVVLPDAVHTAALAAEALGCEVGAIANSLLFDADGAPVLVLTSGAHRVDTAKVAARVGVGRLKRATPEFVREHT